MSNSLCIFDDMNLLKNEKIPSKEVLQLNGEHGQKCPSSFSCYDLENNSQGQPC